MNYLLLDAANMEEDMAIAKAFNPNHQCLYFGAKAQELGVVAPFLFTIQVGSPFFEWYITHPERHKWGVLLKCDEGFKTVWQHFRKFLIVKTEHGKKLYFRFYDPRVFPPFLKTCNSEQLVKLFGPVQTFLSFNKKGVEKVYSLNQGRLIIQEEK